VRHSASKFVATTALLAGSVFAVSAAASRPAGALTPSTIPAHAVFGAKRVSTAGLVIGLDLYVAPRDPAALTQFIRAVSTPGSASYHHYLAHGQFASRFGPTSGTLGAIESYLRGHGMRAVSVTPDHLFVRTSGSVHAVEALLHTTIHAYLAKGHRVYSNVTAARLPAALAGRVQTVVGLSDAPSFTSWDSYRAVARPRTTTCSQATAGTNATTGPFTIAQVGDVYGYDAFANSDDDGQGQTVAVFELTDYVPADIQYYQSCNGGSSDQINSMIVDGGDGIDLGAEVEADLDIEIVATLAPDATIDVYQGPNSEDGVVDTYDRIAVDDLAAVTTTSWGICETVNKDADIAESAVFDEMATQGQTIVAAAGDSGASDCFGYDATQANPLAGAIGVDDPASQPNVLAVGGTTINDAQTIASNPDSQIVWDTQDQGGSGGGVSSVWHEPSYQDGVPGASSAGRTVPDVSLDADPASGYMIYTAGYGWIPIGGTSCAAPMMATLVALSDQASGERAGLMQPVLYADGTSDQSQYFDDVTMGNNEVYDVPGFDTAAVGFDDASGWGSPIASAFDQGPPA
jgi:subtilase family serine protease